MPSGGHARSGPAPDPNALRRERDKGAWLHLPASGRPGDAPKWPLSAATPRERTMWREEWSRPQAVAWEALGLEREVAMYVRSLRDAEQRNARTAARTLLRGMATDLGLNVPGLARNRWVIDDGDKPSTAVESTDKPRTSARERFEVITGAGA